MTKAKRINHGQEVSGIDVDAETRCGHWHGETDIIALKFKCCGDWFPCYECHAEIVNHDAEVWPRDQRGELAVLCGACGRQITIEEYLSCSSICPTCERAFNPGCANHYHLYFE